MNEELISIMNRIREMYNTEIEKGNDGKEIKTVIDCLYWEIVGGKDIPTPR